MRVLQVWASSIGQAVPLNPIVPSNSYINEIIEQSINENYNIFIHVNQISLQENRTQNEMIVYTC